jgi:bifunctional non-homologous end joining protein LigD
LCSSPFIRPCEPTLRDRLPKGEGWLYEVKFDGYRMQVHKTGRAVTLYTRNGADWTERFPHLAAALASIPGSAVIDAELVHPEERAGCRAS